MANDLYRKGSEWRRWDLHVHSPLSILNNQFPKLQNGDPDWDAFLKRLEELPFAVVGITDYFTIDGYKQLLTFKKAGRLANVACILPNIEFRLDNVISSKKDGAHPRRLNLHVIFSNDVSPQDIEEHFLYDLPFHFEGNPQDKDDVRRLKVTNLEALGKQLIAQHKHFQELGRSPLQIGAMNAVVSHLEITKALTQSTRFKDKYLIVFPEELSNLIDWDGQDHHTRKGLLQKSDMVFSSNSHTRQWCLGQTYDSGPSGYISEFKTLKPCIHGSDAHSIAEMGVPCGRRGDEAHNCEKQPEECDLRYTWIKADPSFEGLRQLLYEPSDRVCIQPTDPTPVKSNYSIDSVDIGAAAINSELTVAASSLSLSPGLVAVAGGKGSGKTALVDLIANCYIDRCNSEDKNSFVRRVNEDAGNIHVELTFHDKTQFAKDMSEHRFVEEGDIVYIAQGELERYIGDNSDLDRYINDLVFESPHVKDTVTAFEFLSLADRIVELQATLDDKHRTIDEMERATAIEVMEGVVREGKQAQADLKDVEARLKEFETRLSKDKLEASQNRQKAVATLQQSKQHLIDARTLVAEALRFTEAEIGRFRTTIEQLNAVLKAADLGEALAVPAYPDATRLAEIRQAIEGRLKAVVGEIEKHEKEIKTLEAGIREHAKALNQKRELQERIEKLRQRYKVLVEVQKQLEQARKDRTAVFEDLLKTIMAQREKYAEVIALFSSDKRSVLSDLSFVADIMFAPQQLLASAEAIVDNRQVIVFKTEHMPSVFDGLVDMYAKLAASQQNVVTEIGTEVSRLAEELKPRLKKSKAITPLGLYKVLFGTYLAVRPAVRYKKTPLSRLSLGQKATVLIKIYLAQGTSPIVIDSHDEHLDNEFIMDELVGALREAKGYRQVIIASNNGNVVINSDAEQIIVANRVDAKISYISGSIENPVIRERALKVLEGGVDAFRRRREKYRITG